MENFLHLFYSTSVEGSIIDGCDCVNAKATVETEQDRNAVYCSLVRVCVCLVELQLLFMWARETLNTKRRTRSILFRKIKNRKWTAV